MRKIFGTDGIRGKTNVYPMDAETILKLGKAFAIVLKQDSDLHKVIIGKDTRLSGYIFEGALTAGLCSMGVDVHLVGPMPTPAIAHLTKSFAADAGIMISASHNPAGDNGIKFFSSAGFKLADEIEIEIENHMEDVTSPKHPGKAYRVEDAHGRYIEFAKQTINNTSLKGLKIVLDCAHGAGYFVSPMILEELGATVITINNKPNGTNINENCGSLHIGKLQNMVTTVKADCGIALDGDADRVIMVDEKGSIVDGDHIMALCAIALKKKKKLSHDTVVGTVMSNLGLEIALKKHDIKLIRAPVGDRYVIEEMKKGGYNFGGEQSGHIIFLDHTTTGDGTIAALQVLHNMADAKKTLSELTSCMKTLPQILINVPVKKKLALSSLSALEHKIKDIEAQHMRVLVRYSGTENLCRVMVEGEDEKMIEKSAQILADIINKELGE